MTLADKIRSMSDLELAVLFYSTLSSRDEMWIERMKELGVSATNINCPIVSIKSHLEILRKEM